MRTKATTEGTTAPEAKPAVPLLLSQREAAAYLGLSRAAWYRLRAAGALPLPVRPTGGDLRWRRLDLEEWAANLRSVKRPRRVGVAAEGDGE